jgi:coenzyme F420-reducing hydrogenase alpha subunit
MVELNKIAGAVLTIAGSALWRWNPVRMGTLFKGWTQSMFSGKRITQPDRLRKETEKIMRSYDPCILCSAHTVVIDRRKPSQD